MRLAARSGRDVHGAGRDVRYIGHPEIVHTVIALAAYGRADTEGVAGWLGLLVAVVEALCGDWKRQGAIRKNGPAAGFGPAP